MSAECPLRAAWGKLLVRRHKPNEVSPGGIILPVMKDLYRGDVLDVGPPTQRGDNIYLVHDSIVGSTVFWRSHAGSTIEWGDEIYVVLDYEDVMAILKNPGEPRTPFDDLVDELNDTVNDERSNEQRDTTEGEPNDEINDIH